MPPGKAAAQAGHAFLEAFFAAQQHDPDSAASYRADPPGTKVTLTARSEEHLLRLADRAAAAGLAPVLITDSGHILPPHFDGGPVLTALGIGPARASAVRPFLRSLDLYR